jgi:hypothetical protein
LSYDFPVSVSKFCRINSDTDSDTERAILGTIISRATPLKGKNTYTDNFSH